jgi:hypothetical protein
MNCYCTVLNRGEVHTTATYTLFQVLYVRIARLSIYSMYVCRCTVSFGQGVTYLIKTQATRVECGPTALKGSANPYRKSSKC